MTSSLPLFPLHTGEEARCDIRERVQGGCGDVVSAAGSCLQRQVVRAYQCNECLQISRVALGRLAGMGQQRPLGATSGYAQLDKYLVGIPERLRKGTRAEPLPWSPAVLN